MMARIIGAQREGTRRAGSVIHVSHAERYDGFALDLDGVVWLAGEPIPGSVEAIAALRAAGKRVVFITNDPRSTRADYVRRLREIGVDVSIADVLTSGTAVGEAISREAPGARVFVAGSDALRRELEAFDLRSVSGRGDAADAVVVGGHSGFDYAELRDAAVKVRGGADLWATNRDPVYPTPQGPAPGTGALVAAIETAAGRRARVAGKPEPPMFEAARRRLGVERPAIVGDSLDADIAGGARAGFGTVLVLSGRAQRADLDGSPVRPDLVLSDLRALVS
jgi:HAD superfamily hydrolase (TIGR01450 family)